MFGWDLTKKQELNDLQAKVEYEFEEFVSEMKEIAEKTIAAFRKLEPKINVINSEKASLRHEIYALHKFLSTYEDMGVRISTFDFIEEEFLDFGSDKLEELNYESLKFERDNFTNISGIIAAGGAVIAGGGIAGAGVAGAAGVKGAFAAFGGAAALKGAGVAGLAAAGAGAAMVGGVVLAPIGVGIGIFQRSKNKKKITELTKLMEDLRFDWWNKLTQAKDALNFAKDTIPQIVDLYWNCISMVGDAVKYSILPELKGVQCFFVADAIKEGIKYDKSTDSIRPNPVSMYKDTPYHKHYQFVKNAFDFYTIICKFFTTAVLADLLDDISLSKDVQDKLEIGIAEIRESLVSVQDNMQFTEV